MEEMAGIEKGQKPVPSSPRVGGQSCSWLKEGRRMCPEKTKGKGMQKTPQNLFASSERFQAA